MSIVKRLATVKNNHDANKIPEAHEKAMKISVRKKLIVVTPIAVTLLDAAIAMNPDNNGNNGRYNTIHQ